MTRDGRWIFGDPREKPGLRGGPFRQKKAADTIVCRLRLSHRLGQDAADVAQDVAVGDGLYSSTEMVARVRRFRRTMPIRRLWVVFTPSAVNSTGVLLRRVLTRLPIVPQLLQPLEQGQHIGTLGQADAVQPGDRPSRASDRKSSAKFWSYH